MTMAPPPNFFEHTKTIERFFEFKSHIFFIFTSMNDVELKPSNAMKLNLWMKLCWLIWTKSHGLNYHGIMFIHKIMVARWDMPLLGTSMGVRIFNSEPNIILPTPWTNKTGFFLGRLNTCLLDLVSSKDSLNFERAFLNLQKTIKFLIKHDLKK